MNEIAKPKEPTRACRRWTEFKSNIYQPWPLDTSVLANTNTKIPRISLALCIVGSLRTMFHPNVSSSIVNPLVDKINPNGSTDVLFVMSEEHGPRGGVHVAPRDSQCSFYAKLNVVHAAYVNKPFPEKIDICRQAILEQERMHGRRYDWVMRIRPDELWMRVSVNLAIAKQNFYFRDDQVSSVGGTIKNHLTFLGQTQATKIPPYSGQF